MPEDRSNKQPPAGDDRNLVVVDEDFVNADTEDRLWLFWERNQDPIVKATVSMIAGFEKADDKTIVLSTKYPFSFLPYLLPRLLIASPAQWEAVGKTWAEFSKKPSGTGPFKITKVVPGQYAEMSRNEEYWDKTRIPKLDKLVVYPMPESTTRVAALRSGQVDWIEVPPPDAIPSLRKAQAVFDPAEQTALLAKAHAIIVDEAPWLFIVHDLNPRSMSKKVAGFQPAQSWSQDFTKVHIV